jgi:hypothetical protein
MEGLITENGEVFLITPEGKPRRVLDIRRGETFFDYSIAIPTVRISVYPTENGKEDVFVFTESNRIAYTHIENFEFMSKLTDLYVDLLKKGNCTPEQFIFRLVDKYFLEVLNYNFNFKN